jgi:hypothetical protein
MAVVIIVAVVGSKTVYGIALGNAYVVAAKARRTRVINHNEH